MFYNNHLLKMSSSKEIYMRGISKILKPPGKSSLTVLNPKNKEEVAIWNPPKDGFCLLHCVVILYHILRSKDQCLFDDVFNGFDSLFGEMPLNLSDIKQIVNISAINKSTKFTEECKTEISRISEESIGDLDNVILQVFNLIPSLITGEPIWLEKCLQCFEGHFYLVLRELDEIIIFKNFIDELPILQQMNEKSDKLKAVKEYQEILDAYLICDILTQEKKQRNLSEDETVQLASLNSFLEDKASREDVEVILKTLS